MRISDWSSDVCSSDLQQAAGDGGAVELHAGEDAGDFHGMGEIRIARGPLLGAMGLHREHIGAVQQVLIRIWIICENLLNQLDLPHDSGTHHTGPFRSEERRVGKECVSPFRLRWSTYHFKKNKKK